MERPSAEIYALVRGSTIYMRFYAALCQGNCRLHRIEKERRSESFGEAASQILCGRSSSLSIRWPRLLNTRE
jgi:hypothetical protein